jgi:glycine/D-amino acid oxidase-like deaminating enzyme
MRALGCERQVISADEAVKIEPALAHIRPKLAGATFTAEDESGDANRFARELCKLAAAAGVKFLMSHTVTALRATGGQIDHVEATDSEGRFQRIRGDAFVMAMGSLSPLLAAPLGIRLPIYPAKGYSVTLPVKDASKAHQVSLTDDEFKLVFSRYTSETGDRLRIAGTAELNGYDRDLNQRALRSHRAPRRRAVSRRRRHHAGAVLDRPAPRHAEQRATDRKDETREPLPEHGPWHAGLDARLRLGQVDRADRERAGARGRFRVHRHACAAAARASAGVTRQAAERRRAVSRCW